MQGPIASTLKPSLMCLDLIQRLFISVRLFSLTLMGFDSGLVVEIKVNKEWKIRIIISINSVVSSLSCCNKNVVLVSCLIMGVITL